jgi:hypothetical protein
MSIFTELPEVSVVPAVAPEAAPAPAEPFKPGLVGRWVGRMADRIIERVGIDNPVDLDALDKKPAR